MTKSHESEPTIAHKHCASCRYHTKSATNGRPLEGEEAARATGGLDSDELIGMETVIESEPGDEGYSAIHSYECLHPTQKGKSMGTGDAAGEGCELHELGSSGRLDERLERMLREQEERALRKAARG